MLRRLLFVAFTCILSSALFAQTPTPAPAGEIVFKHWRLAAESRASVDVSYRVVKCSNVDANQVVLSIFNESNKDQDISFTVDIINDEDNRHFTKQVSFSTQKGKVYKPECSGLDASLNVLKIDLPNDYNPSKTTAKITF